MVNTRVLSIFLNIRNSSANVVSFLFPCRRKAVQVFMGGLRVALRAFGRADASLPEAHGVQALQVQLLRPLLFPLGPPGAAHEATPVTPHPLVHLAERLLLSLLFTRHGRFFVNDELFFIYTKGLEQRPPPLPSFL